MPLSVVVDFVCCSFVPLSLVILFQSFCPGVEAAQWAVLDLHTPLVGLLRFLI